MRTARLHTTRQSPLQRIWQMSDVTQRSWRYVGIPATAGAELEARIYPGRIDGVSASARSQGMCANAWQGCLVGARIMQSPFVALC